MMLKEIYIRNENDPFFEPGIIDYQNELESVVSQIRMILGTRPGEVLGMYDFGVNIDYEVFNTKKSAENVSKEIKDQIDSYVNKPDSMTIDVETSFGDSGEGYDYAVIDIIINGVKTVGYLVDKSK